MRSKGSFKYAQVLDKLKVERECGITTPVSLRKSDRLATMTSPPSMLQAPEARSGMQPLDIQGQVCRAHHGSTMLKFKAGISKKGRPANTR